MDNKQKLLLILAIGAGVFYFSGDTGYDVGTPPCDLQCDSCSDCIDALNNDTETYVCLNTSISNHAGTCIDDPVNFSGKVFDCQGFIIDGDDLTEDYGIHTDGKDNNRIINCIVSDFYYGIYLKDSDFNNITNNTATSNVWAGIHIDNSDNNTINLSHNYGEQQIGVYLTSNSSFNVIKDNNLSDNIGGGAGLYLRNSSSNTAYNNTMNGGWIGIHLFDYSNNNNISNNTCNENAYGIFLYNESNFNNITANTAKFNVEGILVWNSNNTTFADNILNKNSDSGILFDNLSFYNAVNNNTICYNVLDIQNLGGSNIGDNNSCDNLINWNDTGEVGCTDECPDVYCNCATCAECEAFLNSSLNECTVINLTADIINHTGNCTSSHNAQYFTNIIFECNGHLIDGVNSSDYSVTGYTYGVFLEAHSYNTIRNCIFSDWYVAVQQYHGSNYNTVDNVTVYNSAYGVESFSSAFNTLKNSNLSDNIKVGISFYDTGNGHTIVNNTANNNLNSGIVAWLSIINSSFINNTATFNGNSGLYFVYSSNYNIISGNNFSFNKDFGVWFYNSSNNTLVDNTIINNNLSGVSFYIISSGNNITGNAIIRNLQNGIDFYSQTSIENILFDNIICNNNLDGGYFDIYDSDSNSGDDNTCFSTSGWNDTGTVGCSFDCINFCNLTYDVNYEDVVRGYVENKVWAKAGNSISMFDFQNNTTSSFSMNTTIIPTLSVDMNKTVNKSQVYKNSIVKYNFTVINTGDAVLTCSIYDDDVYWISSYEDLNTAFSSWKYNSYKPDYHVFTVPVEGNRTFFANRGIISTLTNNASVSCLFKNYTVSDYDTETVYVCHLTVTKSVNQTVVEQGGVVSYNITVFNDGDCNMTNITAVDSSDVDIPVIALMAPGESLSCIYNYSFTNLSLITNCTWS